MMTDDDDDDDDDCSQTGRNPLLFSPIPPSLIYPQNYIFLSPFSFYYLIIQFYIRLSLPT